MLRYVVFFLILHSACACRDSQSKSPTFKTDNFKEHYINEIKGTLLLPFDFQRITNEKLPYVISEANSTSVLNRVIANLDSDRRDYAMFYKENNQDDIILIHKSEFVDFSKRDANQYLGMVESNMRYTYGHGNYARLQKKMSQTERSKYIKIKYKITIQNESFHQTQYVVTSSGSSFGLIELRRNVEDYEDLIKRINYLVN